MNAAAKNETLLPAIYVVAALPILAGAAVLMMSGLFQRTHPINPGSVFGPLPGPGGPS